ncbi:hypothetical protein H2203_007846 [Taxawa tesnikishii (nom. ined.)]|nr:hypothetical protein H2203_007846 [Dothideales sp. JES 119]
MAFTVPRSRPVLRNAALHMRCCRYSSTDAPASPLLLKLKGDLKTAMKSKDKNRLNVVRNILAEVNNSAKTNSPIQTDMQVLGLLRKRTTAAQTAAKEFSDAGRSDLKESEDAQIAIMDEYAGSVQTMGKEEIKDVVTRTVDQLRGTGGKVPAGEVMKRLLAPGGDLDGKNVEKAEVAKAVKEVLAQQ